MALYSFALKDRGDQAHCKAFRLIGRDTDLKGVELTVYVGVYPKEGVRYTGCSIVDSSLPSLFKKGSMVRLVRRMNDVDIEMD